MTSEGIEARLDRVERSNRRLRILLGVVVLVGGGFAAMGNASPDTSEDGPLAQALQQLKACRERIKAAAASRQALKSEGIPLIHQVTSDDVVMANTFIVHDGVEPRGSISADSDGSALLLNDPYSEASIFIHVSSGRAAMMMTDYLGKVRFFKTTKFPK